MRSEKTKWSAEVVQNQFGPVVCWFAVTSDLFPVYPVADGEVEGRPMREVHDCNARWAFLVFIKNDQSCIVPIRSEFCDFTDGELIREAVR